MQTWEENRFLSQILANPDDDFYRLIYADWLDEQNSPLGELIRTQCRLEWTDSYEDLRVLTCGSLRGVPEYGDYSKGLRTVVA